MKHTARTRSFLRSHVLSIIPFNNGVYRICKAYVDFCNGENNSDIASNGELRLLREVLPTCKVVFDVGANVGHWAELALSINPNIEMHCFEPLSQAFEGLSAKNWSGDVFLNRFGLCREGGTREIHYYPSHSTLSSLYLREGIEHVVRSEDRKTEFVELKTLDGYCKCKGVHTVDFIKIDVEGNELNVLKGAEKMLSQKAIRYIQFEYGGANIDSRVFIKDILEFLWSFGYDVCKIYNDRLDHIKHYQQKLDNFQYQNWFAYVQEK